MGCCQCWNRLFKRHREEMVDDRRLIVPGFPSMEYCDNHVKSSKYTILTFLPLNFFEQFNRPINLYFLLVTALQFVPSVAPVSPFTTLIPLTIAFLITAIKEGIDDWKRHRLDDAFNSRLYNVVNLDTLQLQQVRSEDIHVGDLLLLLPMEIVPCDVVLLLSSEDNGEVQVSTETLDGETICKERISILGDLYAQQMVPSASTFDSTAVADRNVASAMEFIQRAACRIDSEGPNPFLNSYSGAARVCIAPEDDPAGEGREVLLGISAENVALTSSVIKNTQFTFGVTVMTGNETKVAMTRDAPPTKWSMIDQKYNRMAIAVFVLQFIIVAVYVSLSNVNLSQESHFWYLGAMGKTALAEYFFVLPSRFFSLVSPMVPLSFKVMVDLSKAYISKMITWDEDLSDETGATEVHNSSLTEDLGQVEYIMTDKTGTLTRNNMTLKNVVAASGLDFSPGMPHVASSLLRAASVDNRTCQLMRVLVYCNTVESSARATCNLTSVAVKRRLESSSLWISPSPDEVALVEGSAMMGAKLLERTRKRIFASFGENMEAVSIIKVLKFTPERRRASVLVRVDGEPNYLLLMKGSDESVLPRCVGNEADRHRAATTLDRLSREGLRTLVAAYRELSEKEVQSWLTELADQESIPSTERRAPAVALVYEQLERDLTFCGLTAVEDELQDEVVRTIFQLRWAGMRVWMLTGDKSQTAKQTAIASGLLGANDDVINLTPNNVEALSVRQHLDHVTDSISTIMEMNQFHSAEERHKKMSGWYTRSGMRSFVEEFTRLPRVSELQPVCHPFYRDQANTSISRNDKGINDSPSPPLEPDCIYEEGWRLSVAPQPGRSDERYFLILSGKTVELMKDCGDRQLFLNFKRVLLHASTVICSRMTPDQKAFIVQAVKDAGHSVLAVGDGGNDVAMIQCAHVGVGIKGKEGNQAAVAADFSISQFRFLSKLLLFHGHTAYQRSAIIVQQSFWKTVSLAWVQFLFNIYTHVSAVSFWDSFSLTLYNSIITVPVTFLCAMNVSLSPKTLLNNPQLYALCQSGRYLNAATFYGYVLRGFLHGTVLFFVLYLTLQTGGDIIRHGYTIDRSCDFYASYFAIVTLHSAIVLLETHSITFLHWVALVWSVGGMFISFSLFAVASTNRSFLTFLGNGSFYLQWMIATALPMVTLSIYAAIKLYFFPDLLQLQRLLLRSLPKSHENNTPEVLFRNDNPSHFFKSFSPAALFRTENLSRGSSLICTFSRPRSLGTMHPEEERLFTTVREPT